MSCCRRSRPAGKTNPCATLGMSTPAQLVTGQQPFVKVKLHNEWVRAEDAVKALQCDANSLAGRLVLYINNLLSASFKEKPAEVNTLLGKQMTLVNIRGALLPLVPKCSVCRGNGCITCNQMGFR